MVGDGQLRYTTNSGGAFSLLTGAPLFFGIMAMIIGRIIYASRRAQPLSMLVVLGDPRRGAGNLTDRLLRGEAFLQGEVVDFVKVGIWPVFNVADSCVVVGGILLALILGRAEREPEQAPADTERPWPAARPGPGRRSPPGRGGGGAGRDLPGPGGPLGQRRPGRGGRPAAPQSYRLRGRAARLGPAAGPAPAATRWPRTGP